MASKREMIEKAAREMYEVNRPGEYWEHVADSIRAVWLLRAELAWDVFADKIPEMRPIG